MSAVRTLSLAADTDDLAKARAAGERLERQRVVRYLLELDEDDGYSWESPAAIADRLLCGIHRRGGR